MYMTYVQKRTPMSRFGYRTPYEMVYGNHPTKDKKLSARAVKCRFLGISDETKGYRLWDIYNNKHILSRDVLFDTNNHLARPTKLSQLNLPRESHPQKKKPKHLPRMSTDAVGAEEPNKAVTPAVGVKKRRRAELVEAPPIREPWSRREAKKPKRYQDYQCFQLKQALELEYDSLIDNGTWRLVRLPSGRKALPSHWVLVVKYNADGSVERFKARPVAHGNHPEYGVDCDEVYAPVARFESLRLVLAIGTVLDCHIHQMDVHTASHPT
ncbi:Integrase, catalytic core protein [Phytophthora megakarya]|uniref:Integrase, catalytic core protein n=1 Tax=Phytophthora megakarya TaxID=4795 RepID=A0A225V1E8_9STRA|nr:Integrase, catalytic core protein [Phytophthora megakarya]